MTPISIVTLYNATDSTCGYCSPPAPTQTRCNSSTLDAKQLSCEVYQKMIDRGWRRSGTYCYKPDLRRCCCPPYTINVQDIQESEKAHQQVDRWNQFVLGGTEESAGAPNVAGPSCKKGASNAPATLASLHSAERGFLRDVKCAHDFQVTLEPSSYTEEKFELYQKYQIEIHHDRDVTASGFRAFLVHSPLIRTPVPYSLQKPDHLPLEYGSYHQMYRLDGVLIAVGVIDILPKCVTSVYFIYDPSWQKYSFGKLSALREILLAQEIHAAGATEMTSQYMGYYIHSCQKMRYKGDFSPSYLLDPEQYSWFPLEACIPSLDKFSYACFSEPTHSLEKPSQRAQVSGEAISDNVLGAMRIVSSVDSNRVSVQPFRTTEYWHSTHIRRELANFADAVGEELAKEIIMLVKSSLRLWWQ